MQKWLTILHRTVSVCIVFLVPLVIYLKNGTLEPWAFMLGAVMGFSWWYGFYLFL